MHTKMTWLFAAWLLFTTALGADLMQSLGGTARRGVDRGCEVSEQPGGVLSITRKLTASDKGSSRAAVSFQLKNTLDLTGKAISFEVRPISGFDALTVYANNDGVRLPSLRCDAAAGELKAGQWNPVVLQFQGSEGMRYGFRGVSGAKPEKITAMSFLIQRNAPHGADTLKMEIRNVKIIPAKDIPVPERYLNAAPAAPQAPTVAIPERNPFSQLGGLASVRGTREETVSFDAGNGVLKITANVTRHDNTTSQRRLTMQLAKPLDLRDKSLTFDMKSDDLSDFCYIFLYNQGNPKAVWAYYTYADELESSWNPVTLQRHFSTVLNWHRTWSSDETPDKVDRIDIVYGLISPRMSGPISLELRNFRIGSEIRYIGNSLKEPVKLESVSRMLGSNIKPPVVLHPDTDAGRAAAQKIVDAVAKSCGVTLESRPGLRSDGAPETNAVMLGNVWNNPAFTLVYARRHAIYDASAPGAGNYVVETIKEPIRRGADILAVGASDDAGLLKGADAAAELIAQYGKPGVLTTPLLFRADYGADQKKLFQKADFNEGLRYAREVHESGRHQSLAKVLQEIGDRYRISRNPSDAKLFAAVAKMYSEYAANPDPRRYSGIWGQDSDFAAIGAISGADTVEHDPALTDQERLDIVRLLNDWIYGAVRPKAETQSFKVAHNHGTFGALGSVMAGLYFSKYYPEYPDGKILLRAGDRIFAVQNAAGKVHDDCNSYQWLTWDHVMRYAALRPDNTVLENGVVQSMRDMLISTMDNDRYQVPFGDTGLWTCYRGDAIPLNIAACLTRDPALEWTAREKYLRWRNESRLWSSTTYGIFNRGESAELPAPQEFNGIRVLPLSPAFYETEPPADGKPALQNCFDKVSFRQSFDPDAFYLLTDGINGGGHGHADAMSIERLMNHGRQWLGDNHYYQGATGFHNSLTVIFNGFWAPYGPYAELLDYGANDDLGILSMKLPGKSFDWIRHLVWFRSTGALAVLDAVLPHEDAQAVLRQKWNCVGTPSARSNTVELVQNGAQMLLETNPGIAPRIAPNAELAANWQEYPHAPGEVHCVEFARTAALRKNELKTLCALWHSNADGGNISAKLTDLTNGGVKFTLDGKEIAIHPLGSDRIAIMMDGSGFTTAQGNVNAIAFAASETVSGSADDTKATYPQLPDGNVFAAENARSLTAVNADGISFAAGTASGKIYLLNEAGNVLGEIAAASPVNALDAGDVNGDGQVEIIAGLEDETVCAYSLNGAELWRFKIPFYRYKAVVNAVKIADLNRDGKKEILIANNNWRTIAIDGTGKQLWYYETVREGRFIHCADLDGNGQDEALVGTKYYHVMALSPDGMVKWKTKTNTPGCLSAATIDDGDKWKKLILGTDGGEIMFFKNGTKIAEYQTGDQIPALAAAIADGAPTLYCASLNGMVYRYSPDGAKLFWTCNLGSGVTALAPMGDHLWAGTADGEVFKIAANGQILAEKQLSGKVLQIVISQNAAAVLTTAGVTILP